MKTQLLHYFLAHPVYAFGLTMVFFLFLYFFFTGTAWMISRFVSSEFKIDHTPYESSQFRGEIKLSMISILIFSLQTVVMQQIIVRGWAQINTEFALFSYLIEVFVLFLWNEFHFYIVHWMLHRKWWFRKVHYIHHKSYNPTPFSVYSFSWVEALLLGSVIFFPLVFYQFQIFSLLSLPILSIILNVLGHWNYDFFQSENASHWSKFTFRHSLHHSKVSGNFGFLLPIFDRLFKTDIKN